MTPVLVVFCFLCVTAAVGNEQFPKLDAIQQEPTCSKAGGRCTIAADCPEGLLSETPGLCPQQQSKGIECCHGISVKETRCVKHGGQCMDNKLKCPPKQIYSEATDCLEGTRCCIMTF